MARNGKSLLQVIEITLFGVKYLLRIITKENGDQLIVILNDNINITIEFYHFFIFDMITPTVA